MKGRDVEWRTPERIDPAHRPPIRKGLHLNAIVPNFFTQSNFFHAVWRLPEIDRTFSMVVEPLRADIQRPDFVIQRPRVSSRNPQFVLKHVGGMFVPCFPNHF
ncbi:hypothetical protein Mal52_49070 [Symmachiella dynata]|uniref:Uncharacterized protein n=1 Tax=Symmachiella dynata TaxID=2527995 RepID=A0A517ZV74_9PLAN|nr:hypothetical protein Mal52_49070 [Symmachiella dynata]